MKHSIITTLDGSHSLHLKELNENYHSIHGAIQESRHVFASPLAPLLKERGTIFILEVGLGTGLNTLITCFEALKNPAKIHYTALEAFPLEQEIVTKLNYIELLNATEHQDIFKYIHSCEWEKDIELAKNFTFYKIKNKIQDVEFKNRFDIIYFDAFGPRVQPEMWTAEVFAKIYAATRPEGFLVTYCAKGEVKRTLKKIGFTVETLPGPPGKREMVKAIKF